MFVHKESRKKTKTASGREKVAKVRIAVTMNMCSVWDNISCHTSNNAFVSPTLQGPLDIFYNGVLLINQLSHDTFISGENPLPIHIQSNY